MRTLIAVVAISSLMAPGAMAQERDLGVELSFSGTGGWMSTSSSSSSYSYSSDAQGYLTLVARTGVFVYEGLSLEPEIALTAMEGTEPALVLAGNLSYTFFPPDANVCPFVLVGVGIGNAIPMGPNPIGRMSNALDVFMIGAGAGMKVFLTESAALRFEYRYQRLSYDYEYTVSYYPTVRKSTTEIAYNMHRVFVGVSIFL